MSGEGSLAGSEERASSPLSIAFVGDPNGIHLRRWTAELVRRGSQRENMAEMERLYRSLVRPSGTTSSPPWP